jgi:hypothetical protein
MVVVVVSSTSAKAALQLLTQGDTALLSGTWLTSSTLGQADDSLIALLTQGKTLKIAASRNHYGGHLQPPSKLDEKSSPYAQKREEIDQRLTQGTTSFNPDKMESGSPCLKLLQLQPVGSILLVGRRVGT